MENKKNRLFSLMSRIDGMSNQFTKTDWVIVQYIKNNPKDFLAGSAQALAREMKISDASIVRFAQKVGFSGLSELKYTLQNELEKENTIAGRNSYTMLMQDYNVLTDALFKLVKPEYIDALRERLLTAKRIYIVGLDQNRNIAELAANKFTLLGLDVQPITTRDTLQFRASLADENELFIIITFSGNRQTLAAALGEIIKNNSFITLISNYEKSLCSAYADLVFLIPKTNSLENHDSITREIFILMLFDIIFLNALNEDKNSYEQFQRIAPFAQKSRMEEE